MPPNHFESEVESFLEGSHGDRTHIKRADHHTVTPLCGTLLSRLGRRPQRRRRFQTGPPGRQGQAAVPTGSNDTTASQISHVIYRGHFSRHPKNVAIPTMQIQCLNKSQGNYVRN